MSRVVAQGSGRSRWRAAVAIIGASCLAVAAAATPARWAAASSAAVAPRPSIAGAIMTRSRVSPLPTSQCLAQVGIRCYSPLQYRVAYDLNPLYGRAITGQGRTIVVVDAFGSPTIQHDLEIFDAQWGLPDTTVQVVKYGNVPPFDPTNTDHTGWAAESSLDVEYAHAMAPGAHIVLLETPVAETEGVTGLPEMMNAEKALIDSGVGDVISQSFGATENTFPGFDQGDYSSLLNLRYAFQDAKQHAVTVLASSGDDGATNATADGSTLYPYRVNSWPSSDPLVTSVGGTHLTLNDDGTRAQPDSVWDDAYGAGGGGVSEVFSRPLYQLGVRNVVGTHRGTPDISMSSAVDGGAWVYTSYDPTTVGWHIFGGTSEATPIFAGIVALADQLAGRRVGNINAALYTLGALSPYLRSASGLVDVTSGNNSFAGVTGYDATTGYDLASGWGTIDAAKFVPALAALARLGLHRS